MIEPSTRTLLPASSPPTPSGASRQGPRRVAFVTAMHFGPEGYVGGGERYPLNLARAVISADPRVQVDLIAIGEREMHRSLQPRIDLRVLPITSRGNNPFDHVSGQLAEVLREVDLVHVHQAFTRGSQAAVLITKFLGLPLVITDHGGQTNRSNDVVRYIELADLLMFYSNFGADQLRSNRPRVVVPGGVDDRFFRPGPAPTERSFVLFAGRVMPHKGVDRLLAALPPRLPCVIVGQHYDDAYAHYIRSLASTRIVTFVADADDLALRALYRSAWATVLPSVHRDAWGHVYSVPELMGLTALESMACGTPALVSDAGALPEFVQHGRNGFVFSELVELTRHLATLSSEPAMVTTMGAEARQDVRLKYGLAVVGEQVWRAYVGVMAAAS